MVSPIEEDREQLFDEARRLQLDAADMERIARLSDATARLLSTNFNDGFEELAKVRADIGDAAWAKTIRGEYSGDMLKMSDADLRRIGGARFDNLELIWDYDAEAALRKLKVPLLWVMAGEDQEAQSRPPARSSHDCEAAANRWMSTCSRTRTTAWSSSAAMPKATGPTPGSPPATCSCWRIGPSSRRGGRMGEAKRLTAEDA